MTAPLRVALVQTSPGWETPNANRAHFAGMLEGVSGVDLVVLPEMFSTGFSMNAEALAETMQGETVAWMKLMAHTLGASVCGSAIISDRDSCFNRFLLAHASGEVVSYDKRHLFRMSTENDHYRPGGDRITMVSGECTLFPQVCYDLRFPVFSRNDLGFDAIVYVANWPAARREHWRTLLAARAIENQCYVVGVNRIGVDGNGVEYAGDSSVFDFNGSALVDMGDTDGVAMAELDLDALHEYRTTFPAWKDADPFRLA